jgi:hypothetical protein
MENLLPNGNWTPLGGALGQGTKFSAWTPTLFNSGTVLVSTYSATSGPDSTPGLTLSCTGTTGGVELVSPKLSLPQEGMLGLSVVVKASSASPVIVPFSVAFTDLNGNAVVTYVPIASAAAVAAYTQYCAVVGVPLGAAYGVFTYCALSWSSTGGYTEVVSSPSVVAF